MSISLTLPPKPQRRTRSINIRLTEQEKAAIERLARQNKIPASQLARHFLMQAMVAFAKQNNGGSHE